MGVLNRLLGRSTSSARSGAVAKERLKIVLEYDRAQLAPGVLDLIKDEIIQSISRHVEVSREDVEVKLEAGRLVAEIPLRDEHDIGSGAPHADLRDSTSGNRR